VVSLLLAFGARLDATDRHWGAKVLFGAHTVTYLGAQELGGGTCDRIYATKHLGVNTVSIQWLLLLFGQ
jgi:hypothetical protein